MTVNRQIASTRVLADFMAIDSQVKWISSSRAEIQMIERKSLNEAQRLCIAREPCCPDLHGHPAHILDATVSPRIH